MIERLALQGLTDHFGRDFLRFLAIPSQNEDMAEANNRAHTIDMDSWEERSFLMDAIDNSQTAAVRDGGRAANIALFQCSSWEDERQRVEDMLAL